MGAADASRRFAYYSFMVGTLPSRRLAVMSLIGNTSPPLNEVDELFATCLRASRLLTSADEKSVIPSEAESISAEAPI